VRKVVWRAVSGTMELSTIAVVLVMTILTATLASC
jgi:hypothetical protein